MAHQLNMAMGEEPRLPTTQNGYYLNGSEKRGRTSLYSTNMIDMATKQNKSDEFAHKIYSDYFQERRLIEERVTASSFLLR